MRTGKITKAMLITHAPPCTTTYSALPCSKESTYTLRETRRTRPLNKNITLQTGERQTIRLNGTRTEAGATGQRAGLKCGDIQLIHPERCSVGTTGIGLEQQLDRGQGCMDGQGQVVWWWAGGSQCTAAKRGQCGRWRVGRVGGAAAVG